MVFISLLERTNPQIHTNTPQHHSTWEEWNVRSEWHQYLDDHDELVCMSTRTHRGNVRSSPAWSQPEGNQLYLLKTSYASFRTNDFCSFGNLIQKLSQLLFWDEIPSFHQSNEYFFTDLMLFTTQGAHICKKIKPSKNLFNGNGADWRHELFHNFGGAPELTVDKTCQTPPKYLFILKQLDKLTSQTWLKVFPLWIPMILPIMSGSTIMFRRWVFTTAGFSLGRASFFALRNFFIKAIGFIFKPRVNRRLWVKNDGKNIYFQYSSFRLTWPFWFDFDNADVWTNWATRQLGPGLGN